MTTKRFAKINNELCISAEATAEAMGIAPKSALNTIKKGLERARNGADTWRHYTDESDGRKRWIVVEALPEVTRLRVEYHYQDLWLAYYTERLNDEALARVKPEDRQYYLHVRPRAGGLGLPAEKVSQLCEACGWLRLCASDYWKDKWNRRSLFFEWTAKVLAERQLYGLRVSNARTLERRTAKWEKRGYDSLLSRSFGNDNPRKIGDLQVRRIINLYANPLKPTITDVTDVYNREALERGWAQITPERVRQLVNDDPENRQICTLARHGKDAAKNAIERTIKRRRPSFADALWVSDGSTIQLRYVDSSGKVRSDLYYYAVADAYSDCIVGFAIGYTETATLVQAAYRDAVRKTGMMPYEINYDGASANRSEEVQQLFDNLSQLHFKAAPYNGKSKIIEAIGGRLEQRNMRHFANFKGGNITAKSLDSRANPDFLTQQHKNGHLPSEQQVVAQFKLVIEVYNNTIVKKYKRTPAERYRDADDRRKQMDHLTMVEAFWVERRHQARYTKDGITIEVDGERYTYEVEVERGVEDFAWRMRHLGDSFTVKYDPDDLEYICLYQQGVWVATARQKYEVPMAVIDREDGEGKIISKSLTQRDQYWQQLQREAAALNDEMEVLGFEELNHRTLHKDAYNRIEGNLLDELLEATAVGVERPRRQSNYELYDTDADGSVVE